MPRDQTVKPLNLMVLPPSVKSYLPICAIRGPDWRVEIAFAGPERGLAGLDGGRNGIRGIWSIFWGFFLNLAEGGDRLESEL